MQNVLYCIGGNRSSKAAGMSKEAPQSYAAAAGRA